MLHIFRSPHFWRCFVVKWNKLIDCIYVFISHTMNKTIWCNNLLLITMQNTRRYIRPTKYNTSHTLNIIPKKWATGPFCAPQPYASTHISPTQFFFFFFFAPFLIPMKSGHVQIMTPHAIHPSSTSPLSSCKRWVLDGGKNGRLGDSSFYGVWVRCSKGRRATHCLATHS